MFDNYAAEGDEFFYDEDRRHEYEDDFIMDDESGLTWGEVQTALRSLYEEKGHSGPYTLDEFYDAVLSAFFDPAIAGLIEKGLMEPVMQRNGEMGYKLTELGIAAAEEAKND